MSRDRASKVRGVHPAPLRRGDRMARVKLSADAVRIVPPVHALLNDINAVARTELARLQAKQAATPEGQATPGLAKQLDLLSSAVERAYDLDCKVQEELRDQLADADDAALEARAAALLADNPEEPDEPA